MALSPEQRKKLVGFGGLKRVALMKPRRTEGHLSQVNSEKRRDAVKEAQITAAIRARHPQHNGHSCKTCLGLDLTPTNIWPSADEGSTATPRAAIA